MIIYTNETCPYCKQIKDELTKVNIEFEERLTSDFKDEWQDITSLTGIPTVPTVHYKNNYFIPGRDFNGAPHLINIIKEFKSCSFSPETQVLERIKSLTYNIQVAFGRTDQLLRKIETKLNTEEKDEYKSNN
tara:strand:- start:23 stop:418 length:396 start_codon:yes stop_codon:yes gene_type:complete